MDKKPLYLQLIDHYKQKINNRELLPDEKLPTEMDMAKQFGVSRITSKRALEELERQGLIYRKRGQGSFVLGDREAEGSSPGLKKVVAIVVPSNTVEGRTIEYINGASDLLKTKGYLLTLHVSADNVQKERDLLTDISGEGICGIIYYPIARNNFDILYKLHIKGYPIVTIDKHFESLPLSSVTSDNFDGGYQAASHLIQNGHRRIAYMAFSHIEAVSTVRQRFFGYCSALQENDIEVDNSITLLDLAGELGMRSDSISQIAFMKEKLRALTNKGITAVCLENDYMALLLWQALTEMGIRVPSDLSLVGFDHLKMLEQMGIMLTTLEQNFYQIGKEAAKIILSAVERGTNRQHRKIIPVKLVEKNSTNAKRVSLHKEEREK